MRKIKEENRLIKFLNSLLCSKIFGYKKIEKYKVDCYKKYNSIFDVKIDDLVIQKGYVFMFPSPIKGIRYAGKVIKIDHSKKKVLVKFTS